MKNAMILGIGSGLGSLIAKHLIGKGWSLYGSARDPVAAEKKLFGLPCEKL